MRFAELIRRLEDAPIIAAVRENKWESALLSPATVIFDLEASLLTVKDHVQQAHEADKALFVHVDLAEGIGKDKVGIRFLAEVGVDGIISTRGQIIRMAKEQGRGVISLRGKMIDAPIVARAQQTIAAAEELGLGKEVK